MLRLIHRAGTGLSLRLLAITLAAWVGSHLRQEVAVLHLRRHFSHPHETPGGPEVQLLSVVVDHGWIAFFSDGLFGLWNEEREGVVMPFEPDLPFKPGITVRFVPFNPAAARDAVYFFAADTAIGDVPAVLARWR